jgi:timeless
VTWAYIIYFSTRIRTSFTEDDWKLVQLVLTLFRNVLAIQEITLTQKASGEETHLLFLADSFLELMFQENVMGIILVLTQHIDEPSGNLEEENLLLMEIFHYLFLGRDPSLIARASGKGSKVFLLFKFFIFLQVLLVNF